MGQVGLDWMWSPRDLRLRIPGAKEEGTVVSGEGAKALEAEPCFPEDFLFFAFVSQGIYLL